MSYISGGAKEHFRIFGHKVDNSSNGEAHGIPRINLKVWCSYKLDFHYTIEHMNDHIIGKIHTLYILGSVEKVKN